MKSLYRKFVSWLAHDLIEKARDEGYAVGLASAGGLQQMEEARDQMYREFVSLFPLLTTVTDGFGNPRIIIGPNSALVNPEVYAEAQAQKEKAFRDGWDIALVTGTKPMEF